MAANALSGLTMNPNYHEFGPSQMENELAKIAAGQGGGSPGRAFAMGIRAHDQRLEDNQEYYNRLDAGDAARQGYAMELGRQGQQTEQIKMLTEALKREGVPLGAAMRVAQSILGQQQTATPELNQSDENSNNLGMGKAIQAVGEGVDKLRGGGIGTSAMNPILQRILHGGITNVQPTSVEAAQVKADSEGKLKGTFNTKDFVTGAADGGQISGPIDKVIGLLKGNKDVQRLFPGSATTVGGTVEPPGKTVTPPVGTQIMPQSGLALGGNFTMNKPPPAAPGLSVGPQMSTDPSNTPGELPVGSDASVQPQQRDEYNRVLAGEQAQGYALGSPRGMSDGSLLIPRQHTRSGARDNVRIFRDPAQANGYNMRYEPQ